MDMLFRFTAPDLSCPSRISRTLMPGETLPRIPCMLEQIAALAADLDFITCTPVVDLENDEDIFDLDFVAALS